MAKPQFKTAQLGAVLSDIAERAHKIVLLATACLDSLSNVEQADALGSAVIDMAQRIGWMADFAASQTHGLSTYVGDAEQWMLPDRFRPAAEGNSLNTVEG